MLFRLLLCVSIMMMIARRPLGMRGIKSRRNRFRPSPISFRLPNKRICKKSSRWTRNPSVFYHEIHSSSNNMIRCKRKLYHDKMLQLDLPQHWFLYVFLFFLSESIFVDYSHHKNRYNKKDRLARGKTVFFKSCYLHQPIRLRMSWHTSPKRSWSRIHEGKSLSIQLVTVSISSWIASTFDRFQQMGSLW